VQSTRSTLYLKDFHVLCVFAGNQRDKYWNRWSHEELQQECLDHGLHPDGAMRFLKDRLMRYDFGQTNLTADETAGMLRKTPSFVLCDNLVVLLYFIPMI